MEAPPAFSQCAPSSRRDQAHQANKRAEQSDGRACGNKTAKHYVPLLASYLPPFTTPMTSFIIQAHEKREVPPSWKQHPECPFCRIIRGEAPAHRIYETDKVIALLGQLSYIKLVTCIVRHLTTYSLRRYIATTPRTHASNTQDTYFPRI